ncbi:hypothetical protein SCUCBS95973_003663 [Sporothrix curviconia]|uniref:Siderophore iron transporter n=1 Tax=Sporothrix curviconia TaxID=1260050 RepID=A0ABP0BHI2_9PEZI
MSDAAQAETGEKAEYNQADKTATNTDSDQEGAAARGAQVTDIPAGYWYSFRFLGSFFSLVLVASALFINFNLPRCQLVVTCIGLLVVGRLGDILGRRYFLIGGQVFGVVGAAICAKATSINMLVAGAAIYGVACTTQLTYPFVVQELVPNKHRGIGQAVITFAVLPFAGFGSIIARDLIKYSALGWRWVYMINVIFNATALVLLCLCYFPPSMHDLHTKWTWKTELRKLDYGGILIFTVLSVLILLGLNWGGGTYAWSDPHVVAPLVIGFVLVIVFGVYETYMPLEQPILPVKLLKNRAYLAIVAVACIGQMVYFVLAIIWPQQIQYSYTANNIAIGWMSLTSGLSLILAEVVFGALMKMLGNTRIQLIVASCGLFAAIGGTTHKPQNYPIAFTAMAGFFAGWVDIIAIVANGLVNEPGDLSLANGFMGSMKQFIGTVSVSIYIAIMTSRFEINFPKDVGAAANGTAAAYAAVPGMTDSIQTAMEGGLKNAWAASFSTVYYASLAFAGLGIIAACFSPDVDRHMNDYVSRRITGTQVMDGPVELTIKNGHLTDDE